MQHLRFPTNKNGTFSSGSTPNLKLIVCLIKTQTKDSTQGAEWRFGDGALRKCLEIQFHSMQLLLHYY